MQQEEMSFWDHLEELRWTLFRSVLALFVFAIAGFSVMPWLFDNVVMAPCSSDFIVYREMCKISSHFSFLPDFCNDTFHVNIVNIKLASQFFTHMTSSFISSGIFLPPKSNNTTMAMITISPVPKFPKNSNSFMIL